MQTHPCSAKALTLVALLLGLTLARHHAHAQPTAFTYQGFLTVNGAPANAIYDLRFTIYGVASGGAPIASAVDVEDAGVTNGLFTVTLDFGAGVFDGSARWLDIAVRPGASMGAYTNLVPRQPIASTPYAVRAARAATVEAGSILNPGFIGTTTAAPLQLFVNNQRALRLEDNGDGGDGNALPDGAPNVIVGSVLNSVSNGVVGATIGGGGATNLSGVAKPNRVDSDYATIGGGSGNAVQPAALGAVIAGGQDNQVLSSAGHATISGGQQHRVTAGGGTVGGGNGNIIELAAYDAVISGGGANRIDTNSVNAVIAGGLQNTIGTNSPFASIGGGYFNGVAGGNSSAVIAGGYFNNISSNATGALISGGAFNNVQAGATYGIVAGGSGNTIGAAATYALISGGFANTIGAGAFGAVIAGGQNNQITTNGGHAIISGGQQHRVNAGGGAVGGGNGNSVELNAYDAVISGGRQNRINTNSFYAVIGGGLQNTIGTNSEVSSILGGYLNNIAGGSVSTVIAGGFGNNISSNASWGVISGGALNNIQQGASFSVIGGGANHLIQPGATSSTIAGGNGNRVGTNSFGAAVGGGINNLIGAGAPYATIPGGQDNATGTGASHAFAAGYRAKAWNAGAFVWADLTDADFVSTATNQFLIRASGGMGINTTNPAAALHVRQLDIGVTNSPLILENDDLIVEAEDAALGLYSINAGNFGSAIALKEMNAGALSDTWGLVRRTTIGGGALWLTYGTSDNYAANPAQMAFLTNGNVGIGTTNPTNRLMVVNARCDGSSWINASDRNLKQDFAAVDPLNVLAKVTALPIQSWSYKAQPGQKHIGPVAQDFHSAFGLGQDGTSIATVDADGVALAAIQGLDAKVESGRRKAETRIQKLEAENEELKQTVAELKRMMETLVKQGN